MKVVWTEQALERLQEIEDYISQDSPERAVAFIDRLIESGDRLADFPKSGRQIPELNLDPIREIIEGNYRIVYRIRADRLEILTAFEAHQQFPFNEISLEVHDKIPAHEMKPSL